MKKQKFAIGGTVALKEAFLKETGLRAYSGLTLEQYKYLVPYTPTELQGANGVEDKLEFNLPQDWTEAVKYVKDYYQEELEVGDFVVVLPEDRFFENCEQNKAQKIVKLNLGGTLPYHLDFVDRGTNQYAKVRRANAAEIAEYHERRVVSLPTINGYQGQYNKSTKTISYGCATLNVSWFESSSSRSIESLVLSSKVSITSREMEAIRKFLKTVKD